jgi:16S rRNA A1518/A1519 N6-dimethyltransferase RsmA/KsgA/DIM1 with predicted DNA glycosylase/AP lyase activity
MTAHGKQGFLHRMTAVAMADASITAAQRDAIVEIGCGLGMAAPHINGILAVAAVYTGA